MNSRVDQLTKGLLSLVVILMFTVALIAGQARANLPAEARASSTFGNARQMSIMLDAETLQDIDSLSRMVDSLLALPIDIDLRINGLKLRTGTGKDAGTDDSSTR